uniref:Heat shock protein 70 n=1 Tax=Panagrolaimus sp. JU765 TaxID=591449 RepID=A0AC34RH28_9BILA
MSEKSKLPIGIDLGTANSFVAFYLNDSVEFAENREGGRINPSVVYYGKDKKIGRMARDQGAIDAANVFFDSKRLLATTADSKNIPELKQHWPFTIGTTESELKKNCYITTSGREIFPEEVSGEILKGLLDNVCRRLEKLPKEIEAVITVPAYFHMTQKRATLRAAEFAKLEVRELLPEPVAAALCYQHEMIIKDGEIIFTFDFCGGTFDVTIMEVSQKLFRVIALGGDSHLGGRDFDMLIVEEMEKRLQEQQKDGVLNLSPAKKFKLIEMARGTKEALSAAKSDMLLLSDIDPNADDCSFTREEFEIMSKPLINKLKECCIKTLKDANMKPEKINHVVVVGGGSIMPIVDNLITDVFGEERRIFKYFCSDESIAKGAAMYAAKLLGASKDPKIQNLRIQDALPLSIGVETPGDKFKPILEHNSPIPSSNTIILRTCRNSQKVAKIPLYEGLYNSVEDNIFLGELEITGIPRGPAGSVEIEITLSLNQNGILEASAKIKSTGAIVTTTIAYETKFETTGSTPTLPANDKV